MSFYNSYKLFIFTLFFPIFVLPLVLSSPIRISLYDNFINVLTEKKCTMPKEIKLPFSDSSESSPFSYLSIPLSECRTADVLKEYDEANMLCAEIFDVLKNITCVKYNKSLPVIESDHLSEDVCHDFESLKDILPQSENYLSGRLSDKLICKIMCSAEKYELLCKTLLWSYDTLKKIEHAFSSQEQEQKTEIESIEKVPSDKASPEKTSSTNDISEPPNSQNMKESDKSPVDESLNLGKVNVVGLTLNRTNQESHNSKVTDEVGETISQNTNKNVSPDSQIQDESTKTTSIIQQSKSEPETKEISPGVSENNVKTINSSNLSNLNPEPEPTDDNENKNDDDNKIGVDEKASQKEISNIDPQVNLDKTSLTSNVNPIKDNQNIKNTTSDNLLNKGNDKVDSKQVKVDDNVGSKASEKSTEPVPPATENDNELKDGNFPEEEDKSKAKQTGTENQAEKEIEKPKQTDYEGPNEVLPDTELKLPESSTQSALPDEDIEHQEDKDQDQYNDIENEGEYVKPEYENSFNVLSKNKENEVKSSIVASSNQIVNGYNSNISPKENIGRISEEIAMIAPFPEQEDSHFFFYFLSIVLIIMAGYLIFHNKQKIIALIVEGRHERRRRSHGAGYKKLETK